MKIRFAGGGRMATAILSGLIAKEYSSGELFVSDPQLQAREKLKTILPEENIFSDTSKMLLTTDGVIVIAVKPQEINNVFPLFKEIEKSLVISIVAGITCAKIESHLSEGVPVVRAMPNTPALIGQGITAIASGKWAGEAEMKIAESILSTVGKVVLLNEESIDAVTAISGSGPAYFFLFMKALYRSGIKLGLNEDTALELVLSTARGAVMLAENSKTPLQDLISAVASKGGTTEQALKVFAERGLEEIVFSAALAAKNRSEELSR